MRGMGRSLQASLGGYRTVSSGGKDRDGKL
jgi:hypothetical protein